MQNRLNSKSITAHNIENKTTVSIKKLNSENKQRPLEANDGRWPQVDEMEVCESVYSNEGNRA